MRTFLLPIEDDVDVKSIVCFNTSSEKWAKSNSTSQLIGVVAGQHTEDVGARLAYIIFSGEIEVVAGEQLAPQGGLLAVQDGKAYISTDNSNINKYVLPSDTAVNTGGFCTIKI